MRILRLFVSLCIILCIASPTTVSADVVPDSLDRLTTPWTGDLPQLLKKNKPIRVLVSYNRTNFFLVKGAMHGMEYDLMQEYKAFLAKTYGKEHVRMVFVAVPFDQLIPALLEGRGDIAAAGLTITNKRKKQVAFSTPYRKDVDEVIVSSGRSVPIKSLSDLSRKRVHVMAGSSYATHLAQENARLKKRGIAPIKIVQAAPGLVTEDLLTMVNYGLINYTVADSHIVEIWKKELPLLRVYNDIPLHTGGRIAWAVRPGNKALRKSLSRFARTVREGTLMGNMLFKRYFENTQWVANSDRDHDRERMRKLRSVFQKYADKYDFDWLKLGALAFQESRLNMDTKSAKGAVGIMQVRPATATSPDVDVTDYMTLDGNVHAGTKYLRHLLDNYFKDVAPEARVNFALAAYNAGPTKILSLQRSARKMGLNPNRWFGNVEWAAYKEIGPETPTYVANVQMYYAAFKSIYEVQVNRGKSN